MVSEFDGLHLFPDKILRHVHHFPEAIVVHIAKHLAAAVEKLALQVDPYFRLIYNLLLAPFFARTLERVVAKLLLNCEVAVRTLQHQQTNQLFELKQIGIHVKVLFLVLVEWLH